MSLRMNLSFICNKPIFPREVSNYRFATGKHPELDIQYIMSTKQLTAIVTRVPKTSSDHFSFPTD